MRRTITLCIIFALLLACVVGFWNVPVATVRNPNVSVDTDTGNTDVKVNFSAKNSFSQSSITLTLNSNKRNSRIYYTTNGTEPTSESLEYLSPIILGASENETKIYTIRAIAITLTSQSRVRTRTYFVAKDIINNQNKIVSLTGDEPANLEIFSCDGTRLLDEPAELTNAIADYCLEAKGEYGTKKFKSILFTKPREKNGTVITEYNELNLYKILPTDEFSWDIRADIVRFLGFEPTAVCEKISLYQNGEYKGEYWLMPNDNDWAYLREMFERDYIPATNADRITVCQLFSAYSKLAEKGEIVKSEKTVKFINNFYKNAETFEVELDGRRTKYFSDLVVTIEPTLERFQKFSYWKLNGEKYKSKKITVGNKDAVKETVETVTETIYPDVIISVAMDTVDLNTVTLTNPNDTTQKTKGLYLTDDTQNLTRFKLPELTLEPQESVYFVGTDHNNIDALLKYELNFNASAGEIVYLTDGKTIIDSLAVEISEPDIA